MIAQTSAHYIDIGLAYESYLIHLGDESFFQGKKHFLVRPNKIIRIKQDLHRYQ